MSVPLLAREKPAGNKKGRRTWRQPIENI